MLCLISLPRRCSSNTSLIGSRMDNTPGGSFPVHLIRISAEADKVSSLGAFIESTGESALRVDPGLCWWNSELRKKGRSWYCFTVGCVVGPFVGSVEFDSLPVDGEQSTKSHITSLAWSRSSMHGLSLMARRTARRIASSMPALGLNRRSRTCMLCCPQTRLCRCAGSQLSAPCLNHHPKHWWPKSCSHLRYCPLRPRDQPPPGQVSACLLELARRHSILLRQRIQRRELLHDVCS